MPLRGGRAAGVGGGRGGKGIAQLQRARDSVPGAKPAHGQLFRLAVAVPEGQHHAQHHDGGVDDKQQHARDESAGVVAIAAVGGPNVGSADEGERHGPLGGGGERAVRELCEGSQAGVGAIEEEGEQQKDDYLRCGAPHEQNGGRREAEPTDGLRHLGPPELREVRVEEEGKVANGRVLVALRHLFLLQDASAEEALLALVQKFVRRGIDAVAMGHELPLVEGRHAKGVEKEHHSRVGHVPPVCRRGAVHGEVRGEKRARLNGLARKRLDSHLGRRGVHNEGDDEQQREAVPLPVLLRVRGVALVPPPRRLCTRPQCANGQRP
mmetsp:Transcript_16461/g.55976  ORF Transcript_16461/g.55976 Transcript_16461/m.55976 type:complete len:323 (+) Transcript_16461:862-1830(+)